jgi:radical SAM protein with 4Fe4S-binding SPASM domain
MFAKAYIEITSFCGLNCDFCKPKKSSPSLMSLELFETINAQLQSQTKAVAYHILGDPLTVVNLEQYLDISQKYNLEVHITTSGHALPKIDQNILLHPIIKQINFSLSSFYANNKNNNTTLEEYLGEITKFCKKSSQRPKRFVNLRLWNMGDEKYIDFNKDVEKKLKTSFEDTASFETQKTKLAPYTILVKDSMFSWPDMGKAIISMDGSCHAIKGQIGVLNDGTVVPCCLDAKGDMGLGNIKENTLSEILSSDRARAIKEGFENKKLIEKMCQTCGFRDARL